MNTSDYRKQAHAFVDWIADYYESVEQYPVKSQVKPREIFDQLPDAAPELGEPMDVIFDDFKNIVLPGLTHWQHPKFFAYFPSNASYPSLLAEMLMAATSVQGMIWETSPASTEMEEKVLGWLRDAMGLPKSWNGVIQDTASSATLAAILSARERASGFETNEKGLFGMEAFRVYVSSQTHSSIEKDVKIAGIGRANVVKIGVDDQFSMKPDLLRAAIAKDREQGFTPLCVVATLGTTSSTAIDPLRPIAEICRDENIWLHVDAAYAGTALLLPEYRWMIDGVDLVDSFVFNPHKWLFTNFDCSVYYVKEKEVLINTFAILPEYLRTASHGKVNNYCDWHIQLGRRFRSLKLWFVLRSFGLEGIRQKLRLHISLAAELEKQIAAHPDFELLAPRHLNLLCFRYRPAAITDPNLLNQMNESLLQSINASGKAYLTHTKLNETFTLRLVLGNTGLEERHVEEVWKLIRETAGQIR